MSDYEAQMRAAFETGAAEFEAFRLWSDAAKNAEVPPPGGDALIAAAGIAMRERAQAVITTGFEVAKASEAEASRPGAPGE
jgi:hypothetical protein